MPERVKKPVEHIGSLDRVIETGNLLALHHSELEQSQIKIDNVELSKLIIAAQNGDIEARNQILLAKHSIAFKAVVRLGVRTDQKRTSVDFNDLYQESALGLMKAIDNFPLGERDVSAFDSFARKVCRNNVIDAIKRSKNRCNTNGNRKTLPQIDGTTVLPGTLQHRLITEQQGETIFTDPIYIEYAVDSSNTEKEAQENMQRETVSRFLAESGLELQELEILKIRFGLEGDGPYKFREIAEILGEDESAVTKRFYRALERLGRLLKLNDLDFDDF